MEKPISVKLVDAKTNIVNCINEQNLHVSILEPIIKEIYENVKEIAQQTYMREKVEYEESLVEGSNELEKEN